jgi:multimeric flavodoxin WrbA
MPRKVILLCGSPRPSGNTFLVLEECAKVMAKAGVEGEMISLAGKKITSCIACYRCIKEKKCSQEDDLQPIIERLRQDDVGGLIIGSPVYFGSARGDVMNALQRIGMVNRASGGFLTGKVGGAIAVARRGAHTVTIQQMLMFFLMSDMVVAGSTYWNMLIGRKPGEALNDQEGMDTVRHFADNVAKLVLKLEK